MRKARVGTLESAEELQLQDSQTLRADDALPSRMWRQSVLLQRALHPYASNKQVASKCASEQSTLVPAQRKAGAASNALALRSLLAVVTGLSQRQAKYKATASCEPMRSADHTGRSRRGELPGGTLASHKRKAPLAAEHQAADQTAGSGAQGRTRDRHADAGLLLPHGDEDRKDARVPARDIASPARVALACCRRAVFCFSIALLWGTSFALFRALLWMDAHSPPPTPGDERTGHITGNRERDGLTVPVTLVLPPSALRPSQHDASLADASVSLPKGRKKQQRPTSPLLTPIPPSAPPPLTSSLSPLCPPHEPKRPALLSPHHPPPSPRPRPEPPLPPSPHRPPPSPRPSPKPPTPHHPSPLQPPPAPRPPQSPSASAVPCREEDCSSPGDDCCAPFDEPATCRGHMLPVRTGKDCLGFSGAAYTCCPPPAMRAALQRLDQIFRTHGILSHTVRPAWAEMVLRASSLDDVPLEHDCGEWCAAYTLLVPQLPLTAFSGAMAVMHEANPAVWDLVQCASALDSKSASRSCCACRENWACWAPGMDKKDSGYCGAPCSGPETTRCKQLAAGCGMSTLTAHSKHFCTDHDITSGACDQCRYPQWCHDSDSPALPGLAGDIDKVDKWISSFTDLPGHHLSPSLLQCKFKPSQRADLIATAAAYNTHRAHHPDHELVLENEVSMYVGPGDGGVQQVLMRNAVGLVLLRGWWKDDPDLLEKAKSVRAHLKRLGVDVPLYALTTEWKGSLELWKGTLFSNVNILDHPYYLEVLDL